MYIKMTFTYIVGHTKDLTLRDLCQIEEKKRKKETHVGDLLPTFGSLPLSTLRTPCTWPQRFTLLVFKFMQIKKHLYKHTKRNTNIVVWKGV